MAKHRFRPIGLGRLKLRFEWHRRVAATSRPWVKSSRYSSPSKTTMEMPFGSLR